MSYRDLKDKIESSLFNGYVVEPIPMVFFACLVGVLMLVLAIWGTWDSLVSIDENETLMQEITIVEYQSDGPIYALKSSIGSVFHIPTNSITDESMLDELVSNRVPVHILYKQSSNSNSEAFTVLEVSDLDGGVILDKKRIDDAWSNNRRNGLLVIWAICFGYWFFISLVYYILCNAPRYPRIASIFVRAPYRNF